MAIRLLEIVLMVLGVWFILRSAIRAWRAADVHNRIEELESDGEQLQDVKDFQKKNPNANKAKKQLDKFLN